MAQEKENWLAVRDLLAQIIKPAKYWQDSTLTGELDEIAQHFQNAFPHVLFSFEDLKLALHDLNIAYERNEINNKFYYLATWR